MPRLNDRIVFFLLDYLCQLSQVNDRVTGLSFLPLESSSAAQLMSLWPVA